MSASRARTFILALAAFLLSATAAHAQSGLGPADSEGTLGTLRYRYVLQALCPLSALNYDMLTRAVAGEREAQFYFGLNLHNGDGAPLDRKAGLAWIVKAAEAGGPQAADWVEHRLQNGEDIDIDETKVATALKRQAAAGDLASMQTLGLMTVRGRGAPQDPQAGIALMLTRRSSDSRGNVIQPDLVQADFWFRLGVRNPEYNTSQVWAIEPKLTTAQLDQAKKLVAGWHALYLEQMKATAIAVPGKEGRTCPPMP